MEDSLIAIAQSTIETANKNAAALAESVRASYDGDATDFEGFVDMLFSMFYIMSNEQFFEYLDILCDIYDVAFDPANTPFRENGSLADIYVSTFVQAAFYTALQTGGENE